MQGKYICIVKLENAFHKIYKNDIQEERKMWQNYQILPHKKNKHFIRKYTQLYNTQKRKVIYLSNKERCRTKRQFESVIHLCSSWINRLKYQKYARQML